MIPSILQNGGAASPVGDDHRHHHFSTICATRWRPVRLHLHINSPCLSSVSLPYIYIHSLNSKICIRCPDVWRGRSSAIKTPAVMKYGNSMPCFLPFKFCAVVFHVLSTAICSLYQNQRIRSWMVLSVRKLGSMKPCLSSAVTKTTQSKKIMVARTKLTVPTWLPLSPQEAIAHSVLVSV